MWDKTYIPKTKRLFVDCDGGTLDGLFAYRARCGQVLPG